MEIVNIIQIQGDIKAVFVEVSPGKPDEITRDSGIFFAGCKRDIDGDLYPTLLELDSSGHFEELPTCSNFMGLEFDGVELKWSAAIARYKECYINKKQ